MIAIDTPAAWKTALRRRMRPNNLLFAALLMCVRTSAAETISAGKISVRFDSTSGMLSLLKDGREYAAAKFSEPGKASCRVEKIGGRESFGPGRMLRIGPGDNGVAVRDGSSFVFIRRDARGLNAAQNRVEALSAVLDLGAAPGPWKGSGPDGLFDPAQNAGQHVMTTIADPATGAGVVAGIVRIDAVSGVVFTKLVDGKVVLTLRDDYGSAVPPKLEPFGGDWWAIGFFADVRAGLEAYAAEFARINGVKLPPVPVGYMSWYSEKYGGSLNETAVIELSKYVSATFKDYGYGFIQIDDTWQNGKPRNGPAKDFTKVNPQGPYRGGMKPVADQIRALGLTPGLWLLPFAIDHQDPILADRAALVAKTPDGNPYESNWSGTTLDMTRPEARDYVRGFIRQTVKDWGYTYLKLDGLHIALGTRQTYDKRRYIEDHYGDAVFADKTKSNMQVARAGLRAVREGAGPGTFLLGCCTPQNERSLGMAMGLVDAMRVGADSCVNWHGVVQGVRCSASLYFLNGRVWWNDPDSIYARAAIPLNEVQCFAGWVTLTGMLNNQTDWAPDYPPERVDLLRRTMPAHQLTSVRPVDFIENDPARIWVLTYDVTGQKHVVIGLFNWTDAEVDLGVTAQKLGLDPSAKYAGYEFWSRSLIDPFSGALKQKIPARSCRIIAVCEMGEQPALLSTSRHVTQGAVDLLEEKWNGRRKTFSGTSKVVANDPYEVRLLAGLKNMKADKAAVSQADSKAAVTVSLTQDDRLVQVKIISPTSRNVRWTVTFSAGR